MQQQQQKKEQTKQRVRPVNPEDEHSKKYKCKFVRFKQSSNVLKTKRRKAIGENIYEWEGELKSGHVYELPKFMINFLNDCVTPIYGQVPKPGGVNGEMITEKIGETPRFSCQIII